MKRNGFFSLFLFFSCGFLIIPSLVKAQDPLHHDTTYFVTYPHTLVGRFYFSKKYTSFTLPAANGEQDIEYKANTLRTMGIGATYNNLSLNIGFGFGFLNNGNDDKGQTKSIDLQAHFFPHKWALDLLAIRHKGSYIEQKGYAADNPEGYYYRPDVKQLFLGFSGYRVMNPERFSYNAAFTQNEWQKKSAGSLLLGGLVFYGQIKGDSSLIPQKIENAFPGTEGVDKINFFSVGIGAGYAYTLVMAKHFYITGSLIGNAQTNFSTIENADDKKSRTVINPSLIYKASVGYNSNTWDISANWAATNLWIKGNYFFDDFIAPIGNYRIIFSKKIALKKH
jgi:hypothetical protein